MGGIDNSFWDEFKGRKDPIVDASNIALAASPPCCFIFLGAGGGGDELKILSALALRTLSGGEKAQNGSSGHKRGASLTAEPESLVLNGKKAETVFEDL